MHTFRDHIREAIVEYTIAVVVQNGEFRAEIQKRLGTFSIELLEEKIEGSEYAELVTKEEN